MSTALKAVTHAQNIRYDKAAEALYIIDQSLLPNEEKEIRLRTVDEMVEAIQALRVRGAPAIGIFAAYCLYALARTIKEPDPAAFQARLRAYSAQLNASRPTAVNLAWALGEMETAAAAHLSVPRPALLEALYQKAGRGSPAWAAAVCPISPRAQLRFTAVGREALSWAEYARSRAWKAAASGSSMVRARA